MLKLFGRKGSKKSIITCKSLKHWMVGYGNFYVLINKVDRTDWSLFRRVAMCLHWSQPTISPSIYLVELLNNAGVRSKKQPVLSNLKSLLVKETTGACDGVQTHEWPGLKHRALRLPYEYSTFELPSHLTISLTTFHLKPLPVTVMQVVLLGVVLTLEQ